MTDICADCKVAMTELKQIISETTTEVQKASAIVSREVNGRPGPGFTKILKLKFMLKLTYKLIFMSLCSNSNFSHYRKF